MTRHDKLSPGSRPNPPVPVASAAAQTQQHEEHDHSQMTVAEIEFLVDLGEALDHPTVPKSKSEIWRRMNSRKSISSTSFHEKLKKLEGPRRYGTWIVDPHSLVLTNAGAEAVRKARIAWPLIKDLRRLQVRPKIRFGGGPWVMSTLIDPLHDQFRLLGPDGIEIDIDWRIIRVPAANTATRVLNGHLAFAVGQIMPDWADSRLKTHLIRDNIEMVVVSRDRGKGLFQKKFADTCEPFDWSDLAVMNLALISTDTSDPSFRIPPPKPTYKRMTVDSYADAAERCRKGDWQALVPDFGVPSDLLKFRIKNSSTKRVGLLHLEGYEMDWPTRSFRDYLLDALARGDDTLDGNGAAKSEIVRPAEDNAWPPGPHGKWSPSPKKKKVK